MYFGAAGWKVSCIFVAHCQRLCQRLCGSMQLELLLDYVLKFPCLIFTVMQWSAKSGPRRSDSCNIMTGPRCHLWSGPWPGISHTQSVTVSQWAIGAAIWYATLATAISNLQTPHQQQRDSWDSTKWKVGHPTPSFTSSFWHRHPSPSSATTWANVTSLFLCATQRRLLPCLDRPMLYKQLFSKMKNH